MEFGRKELSMKEAYFASLADWAQQAKTAQLMVNYMLLSFNCSLAQANSAPPAPAAPPTPAPRPAVAPVARVARVARPRFNALRVLEDVHQREILRRYGGTQIMVAPFWKRTLAEIVDTVIVFLLKVIVAFVFFHSFGVDFEKTVLSKTLREGNPFMTLFDLSMDIISLSYDLLAIILFTKFIVCIYECLWTRYNHGSTPGKSLMKIRVVYVEAVLPLQFRIAPLFIFQTQREPMWAMLYPGVTPSLMRSFFRAFVKNMVMTVFFPICVVMIFLRNNRTAYDIMTKTIVIEVNRPREFPPNNAEQQ